MEDISPRSQSRLKLKPKTDWTKIGRRIGIFFALIGAFALAVFAMGAGSLALWLIILIGGGVFFSEFIVYLKGNRRIMELLFGIGLIKDLEDHLIIRDLLKEYKSSIELDNLEKEINALGVLIYGDPDEAWQQEFNQKKEELARIEKLRADNKLCDPDYIKDCIDQIKEKYLKNQLKKLLNSHDFKANHDNPLYKKIQKIKNDIQGEFAIKRRCLIATILLFAAPFGIASGITSFMFFLVIFSFISNPFLFILAGIFAFFSVIASGFLMTQTVHAAVKSNLFAKLFHKITDLIIPKNWSELSSFARTACICKGFIISLLILSIILLSVLATLSTCGAWIGALAGFIALWHVVSSGIAASISTYYISSTVFTILLVFTIKHCVGFLDEIVKFCSHPKDSWNNFISKLDIVKSESKGVRYVCYLIMALILIFFIAFFIFHCCGDGQIADDGDKVDNSWMYYVYKQIMGFLNNCFKPTGLKPPGLDEEADGTGMIANGVLADGNFAASPETMGPIKYIGKKVESAALILCGLGVNPSEIAKSSETIIPTTQPPNGASVSCTQEKPPDNLSTPVPQLPNMETPVPQSLTP